MTRARSVWQTYLEREVLGEGMYGVFLKAIDNKVGPFLPSPAPKPSRRADLRPPIEDSALVSPIPHGPSICSLQHRCWSDLSLGARAFGRGSDNFLKNWRRSMYWISVNWLRLFFSRDRDGQPPTHERLVIISPCVATELNNILIHQSWYLLTNVLFSMFSCSLATTTCSLEGICSSV